MDAESLDPTVCNSAKSQLNSTLDHSTFSTSSRSSIPRKSIEVTMASQCTTTPRNENGESCNPTPQNNSNNLHARGSYNSSPLRKSKTPPKTKSTSPRANLSSLCSRTSTSKTSNDQGRSIGTQMRYSCIRIKKLNIEVLLKIQLNLRECSSYTQV